MAHGEVTPQISQEGDGCPAPDVVVEVLLEGSRDVLCVLRQDTRGVRDVGEHLNLVGGGGGGGGESSSLIGAC